MKSGIVLFAHGSRDPEWARPFEAIRARLSQAHAVRLAYLEAMRPTLAEAVASLAGDGVTTLRVVPLFLGAGGHVREDLPRLIAAAQAAHPQVRILLEQPIGEQPGVIAAIAEAISSKGP